ncbi:MAG: extracellular solute-binding protein [Firmicutes bacterium]|nr:extracellular solute-binding protein [Bacillota bacterium]
MFKRFLYIVLTVSFASTLLFGCGGKENLGSPDVIKWVGTPNMPVESNSMVQKFIEDKYNVQLEVKSITIDYYQKLGADIAGGDVPDVMFINEPQNWQPLVDQGLLAEIDQDFLKDYAPRHYAAIEQVDKTIWAAGMYKDALYAVPKIMGNEYNTVMVWRGDWLDNLGIKQIPDTIDEFEYSFRKFRYDDPDGNGKKDTYGLTGMGGSAQRQFDEIFGAYGIMPGQWKVVGDKVCNSTTMDAAKDVIALLNQWYKEELIDPEMITDKQDNVVEKLEQGRIGAIHTALSNVSMNHPQGRSKFESMKKTNPNSVIEQRVGKLPAGPSGQRGDWLWGPRSNFIVFGSHLKNDAEKMSKILEILDDINYDEETALKVVFGDRGRTYDYIDPEIGAASGVKYLPPFDTDKNARAKEGIGQQGFFNMLAPVSDWAAIDVANKYANADFKKENEELAYWGSYQDDLMRPQLPSSIRFQGDLDKLKTTAYSEFITGVRSIDSWDAFVNEYMDKGGAILEQEAQEYYVNYIKDIK